MKTLFISGAILGCSAILLSGCGPSTTNVNVTTPMNTASMNVNRNSNMSNSNMNANAMSANPTEGFVKEAANGGMAEVEMGKLVAAKSTNAEVKKFAQMMVTDHTAANNDLKALAAKKNITLPTALSSTAQSTLDKFKTMSGAELDKDYVEDMVDDHEKDVADFEKQSMSATDPDVKPLPRRRCRR